MRVSLDTNILISYLLYPKSDGPPSKIVRACFAGTFVLVLSELIIAELIRNAATRPYLRDRISSEVVGGFVDLLRDFAAETSDVVEPVPAVTPTRDPSDDFLIAHAVLEQVDFLVSGDR